MKNAVILVVLVLIANISACDKVDKLTQFEKNYSYELTVNSLIGINLPFNLPTPPITNNISDDLEVNDSRVDLIEEAILNSLKVRILNPADENFSFLRDIEVFISAEGLPKEKVAFKYDIPDSIGNELNLDLDVLDLKDYIKKDIFSLDVTITTDKILLHDIDLIVDTNFDIDAKILGI